MSPEAQRIAIAEACGWTEITHVCDGKSPRGYFTALPNYPTDLNAMHEAEGTLSSHNAEEFETQLIKVCRGVSFIWHATAAQRAEAFLKTLNPWTTK